MSISVARTEPLSATWRASHAAIDPPPAPASQHRQPSASPSCPITARLTGSSWPSSAASRSSSRPTTARTHTRPRPDTARHQHRKHGAAHPPGARQPDPESVEKRPHLAALRCDRLGAPSDAERSPARGLQTLTRQTSPVASSRLWVILDLHHHITPVGTESWEETRTRRADTSCEGVCALCLHLGDCRNRMTLPHAGPENGTRARQCQLGTPAGWSAHSSAASMRMVSGSWMPSAPTMARFCSSAMSA